VLGPEPDKDKVGAFGEGKNIGIVVHASKARIAALVLEKVNVFVGLEKPSPGADTKSLAADDAAVGDSFLVWKRSRPGRTFCYQMLPN
jgi:hypothetical protein